MTRKEKGIDKKRKRLQKLGFPLEFTPYMIRGGNDSLPTRIPDSSGMTKRKKE
jgi:hypothetical protein